MGIENLEKDTGFLLLQISNLWKNYYGNVLKKHHGLSHIQYTVLASIYRFSLRNPKITQVMLAKQINIDPMTLSYVFKGLETNGYICRTPHPSDVRAKAIGLTQAGKDLLGVMADTIAEADLKFFKSLGKSVERFNKDLIKLLQTNT